MAKSDTRKKILVYADWRGDNSLDYDLALEVAEYFRLDKSKADKIIYNIKSKVKRWKLIADKYSISRSEQLMMEKAFKV